MKIKTLVKIAKEIEKELGVTVKCTVNEMVDNLNAVAGDCRTKAEAAQEIAEWIYNADPNDIRLRHLTS